MSCAVRRASGLPVLYTLFGAIRHSEKEHYSRTDKGHDFQVIVLTPLSCRELIFSTCSHESDFYVF